MPKAYCAICTCYVDIPDIRLFGCGHGCCARCVAQLARQACPQCRRPFTSNDPYTLHVEIVEDAEIPGPVETATRRLERVLTGTNLDVAKAAQRSLQALTDKLGEEGKIDARALSAAISLLDKRVEPLLAHIHNQRHSIRELMGTVEQQLPLDRDLKLRELRRQLKRVEDERDRARQKLSAVGATITATREDAFSHPEVQVVRQERDSLEQRLAAVQYQLDAMTESELARKRRNPFALTPVQQENRALRSRITKLERRLQNSYAHAFNFSACA
ncbi:hypothetical protein HDZ31DRAFT_83963 [Schizophyllum fasciatum]